MGSYFVDKTWIGKIAEFLNLEDVLSGSYCPFEAHADPHRVMEAYLGAIRCFGIRVDTEREVIGIGLTGNRVTEVFTNSIISLALSLLFPLLLFWKV